METTRFSSKASQDGLSLATSTDTSFRLQNITPNLKRQTSLTGKESRLSNDYFHTPLFNKNVLNRHLIDQGLDASRHKARLENRQVRDKSYYMGLLYRKGYETGAEIKKLMKQIHLMEADQSTYLSYKQKAENQASELKRLQEILSDYNLVDDMYNTDTFIDELTGELQTLKAGNESENTSIEKLFDLNKKKEDLIHELETDISQEKYVTDILTATSSPDLKNKFASLKKLDEDLKSTQMKLEEELKTLEVNKKILEDRCTSVGKSEAFYLIQKLNDEQIKKNNLTKELFLNDKSSLLKKKREYSDLIKCLGNQARRVKLQIQQAQSELESFDKKNESVQTERIEKLTKLKNREKAIDHFLTTYPENQTMLLNQLTDLQSKIKMLLEKMSSQLNLDGFIENWNDLQKDHSKSDIKQMGEEQKAKYLLKQEILELLAKHELEERLLEEITKLKQDILTKKSEIDNFSNIEQLKNQFEAKKEELLLQAENLHMQRNIYDAVIKGLQKDSEALVSQLEQNSVSKELSKMEKEWHYLEAKIFEIKEFLEDAKATGYYSSVKNNVMSMIKQLNETLLEL